MLFGSASVAGSRYGNLNQDHVHVEKLFTDAQLRVLGVPQAYMALVMDGHGMLGEMASQRAGKVIARYLKAYLMKHKDLRALNRTQIETLFKEVFAVAHDAVLDCYIYPPAYYHYPRGAPDERRYALSRFGGHTMYTNPCTGPRLVEFGTTATAVIVQGDMLVVAHVGDSLVALGRTSPAEDNSGSKFVGEWLTESHSALSPKEKERIEKENERLELGKRAGFAGEGYVHFQVPTGGFSLAMTRALGHRLLSESGIIPVPEVVIRRLEREHVCVIAGSDGLWDGMDCTTAVHEVCEGFKSGLEPGELAKDLCSESVRYVSNIRPNMKADNTSIALLFFEETLERSNSELEISV